MLYNVIVKDVITNSVIDSRIRLSEQEADDFRDYFDILYNEDTGHTVTKQVYKGAAYV